MRGAIGIKIEESGHIEMTVGVSHVSDVDKVILLKSFCDALEIDKAHIFAMMVFEDDIEDGREETRIDLNAMMGGGDN